MPESGPIVPIPLRPRPSRGAESMVTTYSGRRRPNGTTQVSVDGRPLDPRIDLRNASATSFDWGYAGRGAPAQLALAILADYFGDDDEARRYYEHFLRSVIGRLPSESWRLTGAEIDGVVPARRYPAWQVVTAGSGQ
jgi:Family of unknown function (DUF6166)